MKRKVTASPRGGVGSNRTRTGSPQEYETDSAACCGELAMLWRSLALERGPTDRAEVTGKAPVGHMTWLGVGCLEGEAEEAGRPADLGEAGRSESLHSTAAG